MMVHDCVTVFGKTFPETYFLPFFAALSPTQLMLTEQDQQVVLHSLSTFSTLLITGSTLRAVLVTRGAHL